MDDSVEEIILILIYIIFIVLLTLDPSASSRVIEERSRWLEEFQAAGYTVSSDYIRNIQEARETPFRKRLFFDFLDTWTISKYGINFTVTPYSTGGKHKSHLFRAEFVFPDEIRASLKLKIRKRGKFQKIFGKDRGQFHHINPNLTIYSSNIMIVKHLLNNRLSQYKLLDLLEKCEEIDTWVSNTIVSGQSATKLIQTCSSVYPFIEVLRKEIAAVKNEQHYEITEILSDYDIDSAELSCIICYQQVVIEEALVTNCCSSVAHSNHIRTWLKSHEKCPYCRKKDIILLAPVEDHS